ncbi:uncharacterized protein LOC129003414 [Macrosteles quadrilineatus]|uniref:uncharacterized protein LOC129003414 n=1 Tax=Macrosteles quadrilineatus TaxID=74068 RepID=UPI0023E1283F|nr:uncharacterized protein LOC129003414 [Macrosteles quadrilineatus]
MSTPPWLESLSLHNAIDKLSVDDIKSMLELNNHKCEIDTLDCRGRTPLQCAISRGFEEIVKLLIDKNAMLNAKDIDGNTSVHHAVLGDDEKSLRILELLIDKGVDLNIANHLHQTPLHLAVERDFQPCVKLLLDNGAKVNVQDNVGRTPLHYAVSEKNDSIVKLLIRPDSQLDLADKKGKTSLHLAAETKFAFGVSILLESGANTNVQDDLGNTPLHYSVLYSKKQRPCCKQMINILINSSVISQKNKEGHTALHCAVDANNFTAVELLLQAGAEVNERDVGGRTPLHHASMRKRIKSKIMKALLESGAQVDCRDELDRTPLHWAANGCFVARGSLLIEYGADINAKDRNLDTPLHLCMSIHPSFATLLLDKGCEADFKNIHGNTPLLMAVERDLQSIANLLISKGADIFVKHRGKSLLHIAVSNMSEEIVKKLIQNGAEIDCKDDNGRTALHYAALYCYFDNINIVHLILMSGSYVMMKDNRGLTPADFALKNKFYAMEVLQILLEWHWFSTDFEQILKNSNSTMRDVFKTVLDKIYVKMKHAQFLPLEEEDSFSPFLHLKCCIEIEKMMTRKFNHNALSDILLKYSDLTFLSNDGIRKKIFSSNLDYDFPVYSNILRAAYTKAKDRLGKINVVSNILKFPLPEEMTWKILTYISDHDMENIIKASEIHCDEVMLENNEKTSQLDLSLRENTVLEHKLDEEKKLRSSDLNHSFTIQDAENTEKLKLKNKIKELDLQHNTIVARNNCLLAENLDLQQQIRKANSQYENLVEKSKNKDVTISGLKSYLDTMKCDILKLQSQKSWGKDKWVDDSVLNDYFAAMSDNLGNKDVLFLGPSVTLTITLGTQDIYEESLKLTSYQNCKYVFLCLSDCTDGGAEDTGSHWSLLFLDRINKAAYHFDSVHSMNMKNAKSVAAKLGIQSDNVIEMPCVQQKQTFECGIHVLANTKYIADHFCKRNIGSTFADWYSGAVKPNGVPNCNIATASQSQINENRYKWRTIPSKKTISKTKKSKPNVKLVTKNRFEVLDVIAEIPQSNVVSVNSDLPETTTKKNNVNKTKHTRPGPMKKHVSAPRSDSHKLSISSDSQGRDLAAFIEHTKHGASTVLQIINHCQPGAPIKPILHQVMNSAYFKTYTKEDCIVILAGTNDITSSVIRAPINPVCQYLTEALPKFEHTNLILSTIPNRYDLTPESPENKFINDTNLMIRRMLADFPQAKTLDLHLLQRWYHTRHGLHLNSKGKKCIAKQIIRLTNEFLHENKTKQNNASNTLPSPVVTRHVASVCSTKDVNHSNVVSTEIPDSQIQVLEGNMDSVISENQNKSSVAFAHCISGDFGDQRQMSQGVAVIFRNRFGRPTKAQCVSKALALQNTPNGALVYSLITKNRYCEKPSISDYAEAHNQLITDFKSKNLQELICSPLGCIRDQIPTSVFAKHIVQFHRSTKVSVKVIVDDERATRHLRRGLKHNEFVNQLRKDIAEELRRYNISTPPTTNITAGQEQSQPQASPSPLPASTTVQDVEQASASPEESAEEYSGGGISEKVSISEVGSASPIINMSTPPWLESLSLHNAIDKLSVDDIKSMLELNNHKCEIDSLDCRGRTPLQCAISRGFEEIVKLLIDKNAMLNAKDIDGNTSVHHAVLGDDEKSLRLLELLIDKGVDLNIANHLHQTPLHLAVEREFQPCVKLLLDNGAKVNVQDNVGRTPLHYAVSKKNNSIVKLLIRRDSQLDLADKKGKTSLHLAAETKFAFGVSILLESGANINVKDDWGNTPLHYSVLCTKKQRQYCNPMINLLINSSVIPQKNKKGHTALHCAVDANNFTAVELLLQAGAEVNERDLIGRTPLHHASMRKRIKSKILKALIESGAQVDCRDDLDRTPLHWAAIGCFVARGSLLIEYGADINAKDRKLNTPLHLCLSEPSPFGTLLLDKGCEIDLKNSCGYTQLQIAVEIGCQSIANLQISKGANIYVKCSGSKSLLHIAVSNRSKKIVEKLIENGADIDCKDDNGRTALHYAVKTCNRFYDNTIINTLLMSGSYVLMKDRMGVTPVDLALYDCHIPNRGWYSFRILMEWGWFCTGFPFKSISESLRNIAYEDGKYFHDQIYVKMKYARFLPQEKDSLTTHFHLDCSAEIEKMKKTKINHNALSDILLKYSDLTFLSNDGIRKKIFSTILDFDFPLYINILRAAYMKAKERLGKISVVSNILKFPLPEEMTWKILTYVSDNDIDNIIKASKQLRYFQQINMSTPPGLESLSLHNAIDKLSVDDIKSMLELNNHKCEIDTLDCTGRTPLQCAISRGFEEIVKLLIDENAMLNAKDTRGQTSVHYAILGDDEKSLRILELLIDKGVDLNIAEWLNKTPLHLAVEREFQPCVKLLLDNGAKVNVQDIAGRIPLHYAVSKKNDTIVKLLIRRESQLDLADKKGQTSLHLAAEIKYAFGVSILLDSGANIIAKDDLGNTPLHYSLLCTRKQNPYYKQMMNLLINSNVIYSHRNKDGHTALHCAVVGNSFTAVELLLQAGAEVNERDVGGRTPLHHASMGKHIKSKILKALIESGAQVDCRDDLDRTPLHWAANGCFVARGSLLIEYGADINAKDRNLDTPLHLCLSEPSSFGTLLLDKGCEIDLKNSHGCTQLQIAVERGCQLIANILINKGADISVKGFCGKSLLHIAVLNRSKKIVKKLIQNGAEIDCKDDNGRTALHYAARDCNFDKTVVNLILMSGSNVMMKDNRGLTPADFALWDGFDGYEAFQMLMEWSWFCTDFSFKCTRPETPKNLNSQMRVIFRIVLDQLYVKMKHARFLPLEEDSFSTDLHLKCSAEIEKMKTTKFNHNALSDILLKYSDLTFLSNDGIRKKIFSTNLDDDFPIYKNILRASYTKAKERLGKISVVSNILKFPLPEEMTWKILTYVSDNDIDNIIKASKQLRFFQQINMSPPPWLESLSLHIAIDILSVDDIKSMLELNNRKREIDTLDCTGRTPLQCAISRGFEEIVKLLIDKNAMLNAKDIDGNTSVHHAVLGDDEKSLRILELLIDKGVDLNIANHLHQTPLHLAVKRDFQPCVKLLLDNGAKVNVQDNVGITPLHHAVSKKNDSIVKHMIRQESQLDLADKKGKTSLHLAAEIKYAFGVSILLESGANINVQDDLGNTPLHYSVLYSKKQRPCCKQMINLLINSSVISQKNKEGHTALHCAVDANNFTAVELLLQAGAEVNERDVGGRTPLHHASMRKRTKSKIMKALLESGAEVDCRDVIDRTPLHWAAIGCFVARGSLLIEYGADINAKDSKLNTPLHLCMSKYPSFGTLLLDKGCEIDLKNSCGYTQLQIAVERGCQSITNLLISKGADISVKCSGSKSLLHIAVSNRSEKIVEKLIQNGADIDCKDDSGRTVLHYAAADHHILFSAKTIINLILMSGSYVMMKDSRGLTPVDLALNRCAISIYGRDILEMLLEWGWFCTTDFPFISTRSESNSFGMKERFLYPIYDQICVKMKHTRFLPQEEESSQEEGSFSTDLHLKCSAEIEKMKTTKFNHNALSDILLKYSDLTFLSNDGIRKKIFSSNLDDDFPVYNNILRAAYTKAKERLSKISVVSNILKFPLPEEITWNILTYISDNDMDNIIRASEI